MNVEPGWLDLADGTALGIGIDLAHGALNRLTHVPVLNVWALRCASFQLSRGQADSQLKDVLLDESDVMRYADDPRNDLTGPFVRAALAKGDRCYAVLDGDTLASYGWCASSPTIVFPGLVVSFPLDWVYLYKAFTLPAYRGRHLHGRITAMRLADATTRQASGGIACVEVNNFASARSCRRLGARRVGTFVALRTFGRYWTSGSPGCRRHGIVLSRGVTMPAAM